MFVFIGLPFTPMPRWLQVMVIAASLLFFGALAVFIDPRLSPWVGLPLYSVLSIPMLIAPVVFYFNLRVLREGFDLERLTTLIQRIGEEPSGRPRA